MKILWENEKMENKEKIIQEVDSLLTNLSVDFNVPKPNYCIYNLTELKKLDEWKFNMGFSISLIGMKPPFQYDACFIHRCKGECCYITLLLKNNRNVSKKNIVHEFFHYKHYVESGYDWSHRTQAEVEEEEKRTVLETRKYMKKTKIF